jgi:hypothetical protein
MAYILQRPQDHLIDNTRQSKWKAEVQVLACITIYHHDTPSQK